MGRGINRLQTDFQVNGCVGRPLNKRDIVRREHLQNNDCLSTGTALFAPSHIASLLAFFDNLPLTFFLPRQLVEFLLQDSSLLCHSRILCKSLLVHSQGLLQFSQLSLSDTQFFALLL